MKTTISKAIFALLFLAAFSVNAQDADKPMKIGYTNVNYIFSLSPQSKVIESELKSRQAMLTKEIEYKQKDFQTKLEAYQKAQSTMLESIKADKETELRNLQTSIQTLQTNAESELKTKYDELIAPESERISKAVKDVAVENGFTYVINGDPNTVLYSNEKFDVTDLVLKKLGINPAAAGSEKPAADKPAAKPTTSPTTKPAPKKK
ncbi:MAG: OmpH family outer membrane protein [Bacteroidota bacterium]